ncbi:MAG: hypothetical protein A2268_05535 [Candidatus Raymondbacteria bacterium RifOxyA12_full_50_37]|uniref:PpiC domain-containing protein n=1 Tax=Candidatus Raymondbacteria bacterium RIFOXYD12_FULL_49_13 TaxID=1817890 RepID=A0A1F7FBL0_UNCRA|nr:MAG: hypothetical protein A2268_05535 [Candidatus Raymondbacteria bacterium RifOxyA12_full_50_37]OGJ89026.1 MAG: hypothetical protein A2248_02770 [Candidatus Raymondbacteria bacterium RIFOXYA2_FULL_49_16]OGJ93789.1 MAG: hypothetical protein A2350_06510 [Candidatus Raymondbacteria bacterium RifOxyB12_full_50_8]OGJ97053.1 MAG: hypothetical protein A2453_04185 [Candidatus Raymondbacteria bacterium RIFOXYC2_FULL_50_21]OGK02739.1 MAG: hypothetical protein A2487_01030 [Candidatus Raymondbacteria b
MLKKIIIVIVALVLLAAGSFLVYVVKFKPITQPVQPGKFVARVGNSTLTVEDINNRIPPEYSDFISYEQNVDYVKRWIDNEILYQAAVNREIDKEPEIRERLKKMQKDLLVSEMISRLCTKTPNVSDEAIEKFYREHLAEFTRNETEIKYIHMCLKTLGEAWNIRRQVTPDNFITLARQYSIDSIEDINTLQYVTSREVMPELTSVIFDIKIGGTTPPINTPLGFFIVKIMDKQTPGTVRELRDVRDEVINRLSSQTQRVRLEEIISDLRKKMIVEYNVSLIPGKVEPRGPAGDMQTPAGK